MPTAVSENRSPVFVPLTLATLVFVLSGAFVLIGLITAPADARAQLSLSAELVQWLCSTGLLIGYVLVLSCALVERRGVPRRAWAGVVAALVLIFALGAGWSMGQNKALMSLLKNSDRETQAIWLTALGAAKVIVIVTFALPIAWTVGGNGETPVLWRPWQRRVIGALIAASLCAGLLLLVQNVAAAFTSLGHGEQRVGMSVVALGVGAVHGLFALMLPARRGSGALPALLSSLLTPVLIVVASLPVVTAGEGWDMAGRVTVVLLILLFTPMLSWLLVRWLHGRGARG